MLAAEAEEDLAAAETAGDGTSGSKLGDHLGVLDADDEDDDEVCCIQSPELHCVDFLLKVMVFIEWRY